jgi:hypothetical protein
MSINVLLASSLPPRRRDIRPITAYPTHTRSPAGDGPLYRQAFPFQCTISLECAASHHADSNMSASSASELARTTRKHCHYDELLSTSRTESTDPRNFGKKIESDTLCLKGSSQHPDSN